VGLGKHPDALSPTYKQAAASQLIQHLRPELRGVLGQLRNRGILGYCESLLAGTSDPEHRRATLALEALDERFWMAAAAHVPKGEALPEQAIFRLDHHGATYVATNYLIHADYLAGELARAARLPNANSRIPRKRIDLGLALWNSFRDALVTNPRMWRWKLLQRQPSGALLVQYETPWRKPVPSAVALLERPDGSRLALHRTADDREYPNFWSLPGGKVDGIENGFDTVQREVFEETGVLVEHFVRVGRQESSLPSRNGYRYDIEMFYARVPQDIKIRHSTEHDELRWVTPHEVRALHPIGPVTKKLLLGPRPPSTMSSQLNTARHQSE